MQLGRTYLEAGKPPTRSRRSIASSQEFPESPFIADARRELETLKKT